MDYNPWKEMTSSEHLNKSSYVEEDYLLVTEKEHELIKKGELVIVSGSLLVTKAQYETMLKEQKEFFFNLAAEIDTGPGNPGIVDLINNHLNDRN